MRQPEPRGLCGATVTETTDPGSYRRISAGSSVVPDVPTERDVSNGGGRVWVSGEEVVGILGSTVLETYNRSKKQSLLRRSG